MRTEKDQVQSLLLLPVPAAEPVVERHRRHLDFSAADGIPAHVTVIFPFKPLADITEEDHARLSHLCSEHDSIEIEGHRTAWFGDQVLYVELAETHNVHALISHVTSDFPSYPPVGGTIPLHDIIPHVTVADVRPIAAMHDAAREVDDELPFNQKIQSMELWAGPSLTGRTQPKPWARVRSYALAP